MPDLLHVKYIGTDAYSLGSVLGVLLRHVGLPGSIDDRIKQLWCDINDAYVVLHTPSSHRLPAFSLNKFHSGQSKLPYLKARGCEVKALSRALIIVFGKYMDAGNVQHQDIMSLLETSVGIDDILANNKGVYKFPAADAVEFRKLCWKYDQLVTKLIKYYHPLEINLFHFTIKFHYLLHIGICAGWINPELASCDSGEDLMKVVKRLIAASAAGTGPAKAANKALKKYVHALSFDLSRGSANL